MKKILLMIILLLMIVSCNKNEKEGLKIGIIQLAQHPSLDASRESFIKKIKDSNLDIEIEYKNAQGEIFNCETIVKQMSDNKVDLIYAIATPAAQSAKRNTNNIPVVFSAVSDPIASSLTSEDGKYQITGTSDKASIKEQILLFGELDKKIKTIGFIYNTSESNSITQLEEFKKYSKEVGYKTNIVGVNNINDINQAIDTVMLKSDALYLPTDNLIASSISLISKKAEESKKIVISSFIDKSKAASGVLLMRGVDYKILGENSADMAIEILSNNKKASDIEIVYPKNLKNFVNENALNFVSISKENKIIKNSEVLKGED